MRKKSPQGKDLQFFLSGNSKNFYFKWNFRWIQSGHFFCKLGHFFPIFEKEKGKPPVPFHPLVTRLNSYVYITWDPFNQIRQYTALPKFTWFWNAQVKLANIYDLQPLSVKWYCNCDRGSDLLHHVNCKTLGNTLHCQQ